MSPTDLAELLKLPAEERAELAITLWESLTDEERDAELELGPEQRAEVDRRCAEHLANPRSAIPWHDVRRKLAGGTWPIRSSFDHRPRKKPRGEEVVRRAAAGTWRAVRGRH